MFQVVTANTYRVICCGGGRHPSARDGVGRLAHSLHYFDRAMVHCYESRVIR